MVSDPYEPPTYPELEVATDVESVDASAARILALLADRDLGVRKLS